MIYYLSEIYEDLYNFVLNTSEISVQIENYRGLKTNAV